MNSSIENGKYKIGCCMGSFNIENIKRYRWLKAQAELCEKSVLGIPNEWIMARLFGDGRPYYAEVENSFG